MDGIEGRKALALVLAAYRSALREARGSVTLLPVKTARRRFCFGCFSSSGGSWIERFIQVCRRQIAAFRKFKFLCKLFYEAKDAAKPF